LFLRAFMSISTDVLETGGLDQLASPVPFAALSLVIVTAIWSTFYLNKAMILYRNSEVGEAGLAMSGKFCPRRG